nr:inosine triphosphate pyrophosphatase [Quercus suber]
MAPLVSQPQDPLGDIIIELMYPIIKQTLDSNPGISMEVAAQIVFRLPVQIQCKKGCGPVSVVRLFLHRSRRADSLRAPEDDGTHDIHRNGELPRRCGRQYDKSEGARICEETKQLAIEAANEMDVIKEEVQTPEKRLEDDEWSRDQTQWYLWRSKWKLSLKIRRQGLQRAKERREWNERRVELAQERGREGQEWNKKSFLRQLRESFLGPDDAKASEVAQQTTVKVVIYQLLAPMQWTLQITPDLWSSFHVLRHGVAVVLVVRVGPWWHPLSVKASAEIIRLIMAPKQLNFITGNANKLAEVRAILSATPIQLSSRAVDLLEIQGTIEEISRDKAVRAADVVKGSVLVEDTCLCFKAFDELPGPYVKWFLMALGVQQFHKLLAGFEDKSAQAVCTFAYCEGPGHEPIVFQGRTDGKIVEARGPTNFGWDACFEYEGQTYAEMPKEAKNEISHRGKALAKLVNWLKEEV